MVATLGFSSGTGLGTGLIAGSLSRSGSPIGSTSFGLGGVSTSHGFSGTGGRSADVPSILGGGFGESLSPSDAGSFLPGALGSPGTRDFRPLGGPSWSSSLELARSTAGSLVGSPGGDEDGSSTSLTRRFAERQERRQAEWERERARWQALADDSRDQPSSPFYSRADATPGSDARTDVRLAACERDTEKLQRDVRELKVALPRHEECLSALDRRTIDLNKRLETLTSIHGKPSEPSSPSSRFSVAAEDLLAPLRGEVAGLRGLITECRSTCEDRVSKIAARLEERTELWQAYRATLVERLGVMGKDGADAEADLVSEARVARLEEALQGHQRAQQELLQRQQVLHRLHAEQATVQEAHQAQLQRQDEQVQRVEQLLLQQSYSGGGAPSSGRGPCAWDESRILRLEKAVEDQSAWEDYTQLTQSIRNMEQAMLGILSDHASLNELVQKVHNSIREPLALSPSPYRSAVPAYSSPLSFSLDGSADFAAVRRHVDQIEHCLQVREEEQDALKARLTEVERQCRAQGGLRDRIDELERMCQSSLSSLAEFSARLQGALSVASGSPRPLPSDSEAPLPLSATLFTGNFVPYQSSEVAALDARVTELERRTEELLNVDTGDLEPMEAQLLTHVNGEIARLMAEARAVLGERALQDRPFGDVDRSLTGLESTTELVLNGAVDALLRSPREEGTAALGAPVVPALRLWGPGADKVEAPERGSHMPGELSGRIHCKVAVLDALCTSALSGPMAPEDMDELSERIGTSVTVLENICRRALETKPEVCDLAARLFSNIDALEQLCGRVLADGSAAVPGLGLQDWRQAIRDAVAATPASKAFQSEGTPTTGVPEGSPGALLPEDFGLALLADEGGELVPRIGQLVCQLCGVAPKFAEMSDDIQGLFVAQEDHRRAVKELRGNLVDTQQEVEALKNRLHEWMEAIRQAQELRRISQRADAGGPEAVA